MSEGSSKRRGLPQRMKMRHNTHFVEELTVRHEEPVGKMVLLSHIEPDPLQPRGSMGDLTELVSSVQEKGILEPLLVRPSPSAREAGKGEETRPYRIISGERRFQAAMRAGLVEVPVIEMDVSEQEALEIALIENLQRKDLTPFEEGECFLRLSEQHGYTHEEIATAVGKSRSVVTESLALLDMPPPAREAALALGVTSKSTLLEIVKSTDDAGEMVSLLEKVAEESLSRDDLRAIAQRHRGGSRNDAGSKRQKPYTFKFKSPDRTFKLSLSFRRSMVDRDDVISALEAILQRLRTSGEE